MNFNRSSQPIKETQAEVKSPPLAAMSIDSRRLSIFVEMVAVLKWVVDIFISNDNLKYQGIVTEAEYVSS